MPIHTLARAAGPAAASSPKEELRLEWLVDEDIVKYPVLVDFQGDDEWSVELIDPDDYPEHDRGGDVQLT